MITVYEKTTHCSMCDAVKRDFNANGVEYELRPIDGDVLTLAKIKGWSSAPIVVSDVHPDLSFSGYNPNTVSEFIEAHKVG